MLKRSKALLASAAVLCCFAAAALEASCSNTDAGARTADAAAEPLPGAKPQDSSPAEVAVASGPSDASPDLADRVQSLSETACKISVARSLHTATVLPSGQVLLAGGYGGTPSTLCSGFVPLSSAELYDPSTGISTLTGTMTTPRGAHTATLLTNGKVLIVGGDNGCGSPISSAELFDPSTGTFASTADLTTPRAGHAATLLPNGKVLITGGDLSDACLPSSAELFDPAKGTFTATGSMTANRPGHTATLLSNGLVLIAGGDAVNPAGDGGFQLLSTADLYDPRNGIFTSAGAMTEVRTGHSATLLRNGKVLLAGGGGQSSAELYDPANGRFAATGAMTTKRWKHTATLLTNGNVLILGDTIAELYAPERQNFHAVGTLSTERTDHSATLLPNGSVLVAGGLGGCAILSNAER